MSATPSAWSMLGYVEMVHSEIIFERFLNHSEWFSGDSWWFSNHCKMGGTKEAAFGCPFGRHAAVWHSFNIIMPAKSDYADSVKCQSEKLQSKYYIWQLPKMLPSQKQLILSETWGFKRHEIRLLKNCPHWCSCTRVMSQSADSVPFWLERGDDSKTINICIAISINVHFTKKYTYFEMLGPCIFLLRLSSFFLQMISFSPHSVILQAGRVQD